MKKIFLVWILFSVAFIAQGQAIDYTIPRGYEKDISKELYRKVVDLSVQLTKKRFQVDHVDEGTIYLKAEQNLAQLNLHNIIKKIALLTNPSQWEAEVKGHFENLFSSMDAEKKADPDNFETIKNSLTLRVYPVSYVMSRGDTSGIVTKQDIEGTLTVLMLDLPGGFSIVGRESFDKWKKPAQEIFRAAQANINKQEVSKIKDTVDLNDIKLEILYIEEETYAGSYALDLEKNSPEFVGEWGTAIAIPNRQIAIACKISKDKPVDFVRFIQLTKKVVEKYYGQDPQPISDQFFWYYKGKFSRIAVTETNGNINVIAPMALTQMMIEKKN